VPVSFAEISRVNALCEVMEMRDGLVPDVSLGTHFFNDLVEMQVLYLALLPGTEGNGIHRDLIERTPNELSDLLPEDAAWADAVRVIDPAKAADGRALHLHADALRQTSLCYFDEPAR
jgi:hypothetical protein